MIVGGGGREHALAWRLAQSPNVKGLVACPGNPGIAELATCVPTPDHIAGYADIATAHDVQMTIVGPEVPLVAGIVDVFRKRRLLIVGPTQAAAQLEGSKIFAKQFFERAGIPTARSFQVTEFHEALTSLREFSLPVVIKADGLAAGKGVVVAQTWPEAEDAVRCLGPRLVIEEYLQGEEVSFIGLSNGSLLLPFAPAQDHKRLLDGDRGPNTGGMGAYCDTRILTAQQTGEVMDRVMMPAISQMRKDGMPFTGFLYAGLMMTADGPKLLEFNVRLGDPETQCLMHSYHGDFLELLSMVTTGTGSVRGRSWARPSVCVVIASKGYPGESLTGSEITGIAEAEASGSVVFHAGTRQDGPVLRTAGGRVLGVTAGAETLGEAIKTAYAAVDKISIPGAHYRTDIGKKGLLRW